LFHLSKIWPHSCTFEQLVTAAYTRLGQTAQPLEPDSWLLTPDVQLLGSNLLQAYGYSDSLVELHVYAPRFVTEVSDHPVASAVARFQAQQGYKITNFRHERIALDKLSATLLSYLDGAYDQAALLSLMQAKDLVEIERQDGQTIQAGEIKTVLAELLQKKLEQFAQAALLVS
jgi:hypothetical protein